MSERKAKGCLVATMAWCIIFLLLAVAYKYLVHPYFSQRLTEETGTVSRYDHEITIATDSFSGYAILRSDAMKQWMSEHQIKLNVIDDGANYSERLDNLRRGTTQLAVFTIDSYLKAGAKAGAFPGSIVLVMDETQGGDALVAHESSFKSIQELNAPSTRIVLTPDSPSEFLARVILAHFSLPKISPDWMTGEDGSDKVLNHLRQSSPGSNKAFVLWQPYVAQAIKLPGYKVLLDSSQLKGYIVDVLVAERTFLKNNQELIQTFAEGYFRALYQYQNKENGLQNLVITDANRLNAEKLDADLADAVVKGIHWKNTMDNYAHFGIARETRPNSPPHLEDMIGNIVEVLLKTKSIGTDPLNGQYNTLFYDQIMASLQTNNFHPGQELHLISDLSSEQRPSAPPDQPQPLTETEWSRLIPVGVLQADAIGFVRGSSSVSRSSERALQALSKKLQSFPNFYLKVIGQTRAEGDAAANQRLAAARAEAVAQMLKQHGVPDWRIRTEASPSTSENGQFQSVVFELGQRPY
jgi:outer membrane protein OmpA-like peptidoglycan-associated protein